MNVDIYRRSEPGNKLSYLIVPTGQPIPEEATNVDWQARKQAVHVDDAVEHLHPYEIDNPRAQIEEKGYAITSVYHQVASQGDAP
ncbi:hypothetical protein H8N03_03000 [Ramlibacter sp. USB13]|uniref:Uncharacterized protein n=1 Tax=Ramlibacter cellulosilyticus TaxID=2764187 RepID=A0A923MM42_9BURK|nr:DUF6139 family protein [Ramlibacter cellulosilyticus]MBC5781895.1 hypothetical protein [Ramlibacter cellulosilyticus]